MMLRTYIQKIALICGSQRVHVQNRAADDALLWSAPAENIKYLVKPDAIRALIGNALA
jgi:hypothetical protein